MTTALHYCIPTIAVEAIRKDVAYLLRNSQIWANLQICKRANLGNFANLLIYLRNEMQQANSVFDQICSLANLGKFTTLLITLRSEMPLANLMQMLILQHIYEWLCICLAQLNFEQRLNLVAKPARQFGHAMLLYLCL